ncbi:hypothetical protein ACLB2K_029788 [Fragaria x ananassa]
MALQDRILSTGPYSSDPDDVDHEVSLLGAIIADVVLDVGEIIDSLRRSWTNIGVLDIAHIHQNVFSIKTLLEEGPWHVENMRFSVVEWVPNLAVGDEHLHKVWYWVQISVLTYEMMNRTEVERIGRKIGTVLDLEKSEIDVCRRKFLRVKVLLDSRNPLPTGFWLPLGVYTSTLIEYEYEGLGNFCWRCGRLGHVKEECLRFLLPKPVKKDDDKAHWYNHYGPWMQKKPFVEEIVSWREEYELAPPQKRLHPYGGQIQHSPETTDDTPRCKHVRRQQMTVRGAYCVEGTRECGFILCMTPGSMDCGGYQWVDEMQQGETSDTSEENAADYTKRKRRRKICNRKMDSYVSHTEENFVRTYWFCSRPFEIIERVGSLAYRLVLPPELCRIYNVFHVSMFRKYIADSCHVLEEQPISLQKYLSYKEEPVQILDQKEQVFRNKKIPLCQSALEKPPSRGSYLGVRGANEAAVSFPL